MRNSNTHMKSSGKSSQRTAVTLRRFQKQADEGCDGFRGVMETVAQIFQVMEKTSAPLSIDELSRQRESLKALEDLCINLQNRPDASEDVTAALEAAYQLCMTLHALSLRQRWEDGIAHA